ncbi:MAG: hypothetical protein ACYTAN_05140 [Planctomycetota bacterium]
MLRKIYATVAVTAVVTLGAYAYAQRLSRLNSWELDFACNSPRVIEMVEEGALQVYTYVIYEVTNRTGSEVDFYPTFEIETDDGKVTRSGIYPNAFLAIRKELARDMFDFKDMVGVMQPGESKRGVAVFKNSDPGTDRLTVYVGGLTGDFKTQVEDNAVVAYYRTYKLVYRRPGDQFSAGIDPITLESTEWVWREYEL